MITNTFSTITQEVNSKKIWELMSDVDNWKTWDDTVEYSRLHGNFISGSTFTLKPAGGPKVNIRLVEVIPYRYFKDETVFPFARMYGEHRFEDTPAGLKITVKMTMTGFLSKLWNKIVMKNIVAHIEADVMNQIRSAGLLANS